jgi:hypothetical protein
MSRELLIEAVKEVADEMTEDQAWEFVRDLPEEITHNDEWMALYLAKKFPTIRQRLMDTA